jgi:hypothetical protein
MSGTISKDQNVTGMDKIRLTSEKIGDDFALHVYQANLLVPEAFDYIALTYVAAGNGAGEVETVTYKTGGSGGTTVATLTLTYNASDEVATVTKA